MVREKLSRAWLRICSTPITVNTLKVMESSVSRTLPRRFHKLRHASSSSMGCAQRLQRLTGNELPHVDHPVKT